jgi:hypothetical protein
MSKSVKYYVIGTFEGTYKTLQEFPVTSLGQIPKDDKHLIRIIRGIIKNAKQVNLGVFNKYVADVQLKHVNNIQINKSQEWPEQHDRIFSCEVFKLKDVKFTDVHVINGHTYGNISGYVIASVTEGSYEEIEKENLKEKEDKKPRTLWDRWSRKEADEDGGSNGGGGGNNKAGDEGNGENNNKWSDFWKRFSALWLSSGCLSRLLKWLLILLLIWWFLTYTRFGQNIVCGVMKWYYNFQRREVIKEDKRLTDIIELTKPIRSQCGSQIDFEGDNQERSYTYTLGSKSGEVVIQYDMYEVPDRMEIMFNGQLVAETNDDSMTPAYKKFEGMGFADKKGSLRFNYVFKPNELHELTIRVVPNQEVPTTKWQFKVSCP